MKTVSFSMTGLALVTVSCPSAFAFVLPREHTRSTLSVDRLRSPDTTTTTSNIVTVLFGSSEDNDVKSPEPPRPPPPDDGGFGQDEEGRLRVVVKEEVIQSSPSSSPATNSPSRRELTPEEEKLAIAAGIGGLFAGAALGGIVDAQNPDIDLYVSPLVPPIIGAISVSTFGFVAGGSDSPAGGFARNVLGRATVGTGNAIAAGAKGVVDAAVSSAKNKVKQTTDDIKAIPSNIQKAAVAKVEETREEIVAIPGKLQNAAVETATGIADEIKATPGRVAESTKKAVEDAVDDTLDAVEEFVDDVKAIPQKAIDNVEESITSILGTTTEQVPRPPLAPPKPEMNVNKEPPAPPKALPPSSKTDKISLIPKIDSIKIDVPKVPNVRLPSVQKSTVFKEKPTLKTQQEPSAKKAETDTVAGSFLDNVTLKSFNKDISFDEKTGRFFETGPAPKFEPPSLKVDMPTVKLPRIDRQARPESPKTRGPTPQEEIQAQAARKRKEQEAARKAAALRKEQEERARAEVARQRKEDADRKRAEIAEAKRQKQLESQRKAEESRQAAEARKRALEEARQEKLQAQAKAIEERKRQAQAQRKAREDKFRQQQEATKDAALKAKRQQAAEKSLEQAKSRTTVSLGSLFGFESNEDKGQDVPVPAAKKSTTNPPKGVPVLSSWRQNPDGSITGTISGSSAFSNGEVVTTSPVPKGATTASVVSTSSGSRYFLDQPAPPSFGFNFGGGSRREQSASAKEADKDTKSEKETTKQVALKKKAAAEAAAERRREETEAKKAAAAEAAEKRKREADERKAAALAAAAERRREETEAKKAAAAEAAEKRKREVDERKAAALAAAAERRREETEAKKAAASEAAEKRKREADERKAAALAAAEEKKKALAAAAEQRKRAAEERKRLEAKRVLEEKKKAVEDRRVTAKAGAAVGASKSVTISKAEKPPQGVPIIKSWKQRPDGGVSGRIYSSPNFADGDFVETSRISNGKIQDGSVVSTVSGSRYFLSSETAVKTGNFLSAIKDLAGAEPGATITLTRQRKERDAKAAKQAIEKARPRSTFSLFGLGRGASRDDIARGPQTVTPKSGTPKNPPPKKASTRSTAAKGPSTESAKAPRGVPTLGRWKKNADGSVTGIITGSTSFTDGERVTTSTIKKGRIVKNEVVVTGSGSRYFLS